MFTLVLSPTHVRFKKLRSFLFKFQIAFLLLLFSAKMSSKYDRHSLYRELDEIGRQALLSSLLPFLYLLSETHSLLFFLLVATMKDLYEADSTVFAETRL